MASETHGSILLTTADKVSRTIMKKTGSQTGYKPSEWADEVNLMGLLPIRTASGSIAHFEDGADDVPLKSLTAQIVPIQEGTGDPSPSNPRPIIGTSVLNVTRATGDLSTNTINGYYIDASGTFQPNASYKIVVAPVLQGKKYRIFTDEGQIIAGFFTSEPSTDSTTYNNSRTITNPNVYEITSPIDGFIGFRCSVGYTSYAIWDISSTYPIALGRTVYGGTYNSETGVLTIEWGIVDLGDLEWVSENSSQTGLARANVVNYTPSFKWRSVLVCSKFKYNTTIGWSGLSNGDIALTNAEIFPILRIRWEDWASYTDAQIKTAMSGTKLVYELATPTDFSFTGQPINSYLGVNNVYVDSGEVLDLEYRADIDLLLASLQGNRGLQMIRSTPPVEEEQTEEVEENEDER